MSWGWPEPLQCQVGNCTADETSLQYVQRTNVEFQKIGLLGVTLVAASGDQGSSRSPLCPLPSLPSPPSHALYFSYSLILQVPPETMTQIAIRERRCPLSSQVSPCFFFSNYCISNTPLYSFFFFLSFFFLFSLLFLSSLSILFFFLFLGASPWVLSVGATMLTNMTTESEEFSFDAPTPSSYLQEVHVLYFNHRGNKIQKITKRKEKQNQEARRKRKRRGRRY